MLNRARDDDGEDERTDRVASPAPAAVADLPWWRQPVSGSSPPPDSVQTTHAGLIWVARFFKLAGIMSVVLLAREYQELRDLSRPDSMPIAGVWHAILTGAAAAGFFRTARLLREQRKSGGFMAAAGCSILIANSLQPVFNSVPVILGAVGLAVLASVWKKLD